MDTVKDYTIPYDSIIDILKPAKSPPEYTIIHNNGIDYKIKITSDRYAVFKKSNMCSKCGLIGDVFLIERSHIRSPYHLNLYGRDSHGKLILFTKDHIIPKSKGGKDDLSNYQTMCCKCNQKKADK